MTYVVQFSGGVGSWASARRLVDQGQPVELLVACTNSEADDWWPFVNACQADLDVPMTLLDNGGKTIWDVFAEQRFLGNTRVDLCSRILKREPLRKWLDANRNPTTDIVVIGFDWTEQPRIDKAARYWDPWTVNAPLADPPYVEKWALLADLRERGIPVPELYGQGFPHNNCFTGSTRFITREGVRRLDETVGEHVQVLGRGGKWRNATIEAFGEQPIVELTLTLRGRQKVIETTSDHLWFKWRGARGRKVRDTVRTADLRCGDRLQTMWAQRLSNVEPSAFGIAHGIVFGDGTRPRALTPGREQWTTPAWVVLCGDKDAQLLKWFPLSPTTDMPGTGIRVTNLPRYYKDPPSLDESASYLLGWLAGYFAADGSMSLHGDATISSSRRENLELVETIAARVGVRTAGITSFERVGLGDTPSTLFSLAFLKGDLPESFFLIEEHRSRHAERTVEPADWTVTSVVATDRVEQVYCAVVPDGEAFTLEGNLHTHNCKATCVKAGQAQWERVLRLRRADYLDAEDHEEKLRVDLGDVSILKDRSDGRTRPLSLRVFRERLEQQPSLFDADDWGACSCMTPAEEL